MTREVGLVSCVKTKRDSVSSPRDLYSSTYFERMRAYAESNHDEWLILSARHGVLDPDGPQIEPYEETLNDATKAERQEWARDVFGSLDERGLLEEGTTLVVHAGKAYYGELLPLLEDEPVDVEVPTEGLRFGETLSWYGERL